MAIPEATLSIRDGGLGLADDNDNGVPALIGCSSSGTANVVASYTDPQTLRDALGSGPMVELALHILAVAGGPVVCVKAPSSTAGAAGSVTATKTGTATLAVTGAALDAYDAIVSIVTGGATLAAGDATFKYSLDGGRTYSAEIAVPTSGVYVIPNTGHTLTWTYSSGTAFVAADKWTWTSTAPACTLNEATTAMDALAADVSTDFFIIHIVGAASSAANSATAFAAIEAKMIGYASTNFRYARAIIEAPVDTDANLKAAFLASAGTRTLVGAGGVYLISQASGVAYLRNAAWVGTARAAAVPPQEDLGKVRTGPCPGINSLVRDEYKTAGLDAAGFLALRTHVGKTGFYVTNGRLKVSPGSDYKYLQYGRVVDIACKTIRAAQLDYLNDSVRVSKTTGKIIETDARNVEGNIEAKLRTAVTETGYASNVSVTLDRDTNVLSTQKLVMRYRVIPLAYAKTIEGEIALENPALTPV